MKLSHLAVGFALTLLAALFFGGLAQQIWLKFQAFFSRVYKAFPSNLAILAQTLRETVPTRGFFLFTLSILAVYALQPALPIRYFDFILPTAALGIALLSWHVITPRQERLTFVNLLSIGWILLLIFFLGLTRFTPFVSILTASIPPRPTWVLTAILALAILPPILGFLPRIIGTFLLIFLLISALIILKAPDLTLKTAQFLYLITRQDPQTATAFDIRWLGFSYIAFRLIHTIIDSRKNRAPLVSLQEYITFVFFYPALLAGPLDRLERFIKDLRSPFRLTSEDWDFVIRRAVLGLFRKFILADSLALIALSPQNAPQILYTRWAWFLLYAYAFQIYLDFSGYTDLALALGRLAGVRLPENFNQPYRKPNLTQFWNNWHMSLTQWFRAYVFNPLTRALHSSPLPTWSIILLTQITTMTLIGLWHGITWNFLIWGLWHGLGLFVHNRWQNAFRVRVSEWANHPLKQAFVTVSGVFLTFHFVALGWVWFVLPDLASAWKFFQLLFLWK